MNSTLDNIFVGIVDDDGSIRRSLSRLLRAAGMQTVTFRSAEEFLAGATPPGLDCLILDVQLPGMSGVDLRDKLATAGVMTPVLFVTAYDDPRERERALAGQCLGYLRKSDSGNEILDAIRKTVSALHSSSTS